MMTDELYFMSALLKPWHVLNEALAQEVPPPDLNVLLPQVQALLDTLRQQPDYWADRLGLSSTECRDKALAESRACQELNAWGVLNVADVSVSACPSPSPPHLFWRYALRYQEQDILFVTRDVIEYWMLRASVQVSGRPELPAYF